MTHEDERRTLTSIPYLDGEIKIIVAKKDCELGNHYHKIKTEEFQLIKGKCGAVIGAHGYGMILGDKYVVNINEKHSFNLKKDSILLCICSHSYDSSDDYTH